MLLCADRMADVSAVFVFGLRGGLGLGVAVNRGAARHRQGTAGCGGQPAPDRDEQILVKF